jgi:hypothetical protein
MGEAGLAQARRPVKQDVVDGLAPAFSGGDADLEVFLEVLLPDEVRQGARPEAVIKGRVFNIGLTGNNASDFSPPGWFFYPSPWPSPSRREGKRGFTAL